MSALEGFSLTNELDKLKKITLLPITNIEFDKKYEHGKQYLDSEMNHIKIYAKLYVNKDMIGIIPYMSDSWGLMYDTNNFGELAWDKVYKQFQEVIFAKILQQEPLAFTAEPIEDLSLSIRDKQGVLIKRAYCAYINDEWSIFVAGLDGITKKVTLTRVVLFPPPPLKGGNE